MEDLYLKSTRGMGNILCNLVILMAWNLKVNKYKKIYLVMPDDKREDCLTKFCQPINNEKLVILDKVPKGIRYNSIMSIKSFFKNNFWSDMRNVLNTSPELELDHVYFHFWKIYLYGDELFNVQRYFNLKLKDELQHKVNDIKKKMNNKYIAIQIRAAEEFFYNDKVKIIDYFRFIDRFPSYNIYLATDNKKTQQMFKNRYRNRLFYFENISDEIVTNKVRFTTAESLYIDLFVCRDAFDFLGTVESTFTRLISILRYYVN